MDGLSVNGKIPIPLIVFYVINYKKNKLYIKFVQQIFLYTFNTIMQLFFTIDYIRIIILTQKFHDHPLVEYLVDINMYFYFSNKIKYCVKISRKVPHCWILDIISLIFSF